MTKSINVLIIDDSVADERKIVSEITHSGLNPNASRVTSASGFKRALAGGKWDVVICAHETARCEPSQALEILAESKLDLPFIIISDPLGEVAAVRAMRSGAHDFVMRSNMPRLRFAVERELREAQGRDRHRQAVEALRLSEETFSKAFQASPDMVAITRLSDEQILEVNESFLSALGYTKQQVIGRSSTEVGYWADEQERRRLFKEVRESGYRDTHETAFRASDGKEIPVLTAGRVLSVRGEPCLFCITRDLSERRKAESEKTELQQRLLRAQRIEAIGVLAGSVAYGFSNWLSLISGHAAAITDSVLPNTQAHEKATEILLASERAGSLIKRLLSVARASQADGPRRTEQVVVDAAVTEAISFVRPSLDSQGIVVKALPIRRGLSVHAEQGQLMDCLINLFLNAAEAMDKGGTITVDTDEQTVDDTNYAVLRVRDTGCGMPREVVEQVFEPFFSTKPRQSTSGLGLTVVQTSIEGWGGFVKVRSRKDHGTSFRLFIPRADDPVAAGESALPAGGETILIVDDHKGQLSSTHRVLKGAGYSVHAAGSADECLDIYEQFGDEIRLSIIDVIMPGKDGKHLLGKILAMDPTASVIMTSGFSRDFVRGYLERGAWSFLQKPYEADQLLGMVRRVLDRSGSLRP